MRQTMRRLLQDYFSIKSTFDALAIREVRCGTVIPFEDGWIELPLRSLLRSPTLGAPRA
jgi:hypothetical protein